MKIRDMLTFSLLIGLATSGIAIASNNVYSLPELKSIGVASDDDKALMFPAMDRSDDFKGVCFALAKQVTSIVPTTDINATVDSARFTLIGLRPNNTDESKELVCILGSQATEFFSAVIKSSRTNIEFDFSGEVRRYSFDTTAFKKISSGDKNIAEQINIDYKNGIRAPVFYSQSHVAKPSIPMNTENNDETSYNVSDQKLNSAWNNLNPDIRRRLLPSQREWIKQKDAVCKTNFSCLARMTNDRIKTIESQR